MASLSEFTEERSERASGATPEGTAHCFLTRFRFFNSPCPPKRCVPLLFLWVQNINNYFANNKDDQKDENLPHPLQRGENGVRLIFNVGSLNLIQGPVPSGGSHSRAADNSLALDVFYYREALVLKQ